MRDLRVLATIGLLACALVAPPAGGEVDGEPAAAEAAASAPETGSPPEAAFIYPDGDGYRYWPRWRGPTGQGVAPGEGYPDYWTASENVLWKVEVPGRDSSSPIVWGDRVFVTTTAKEGDRQRSVLAYRASDGKLLWEYLVPVPEERTTVRRISHAISTPLTDGERLYAYLGSHGLTALDFEGNKLWHKNLGTFDHATFSPLLYRGKLVLVQVSPTRKRSYLVAYRTSDGVGSWQHERDEAIAAGTAVAVRLSDHDEIVVPGSGTVRGYDAENGRELWSVTGTTKHAIPTPVVGYGLVFVSSGPSGPVMAIYPGGSGDVTDTHVLWKVDEIGGVLTSPVFHDGLLFVMNEGQGTLTCLAAATGDIVWQEKLGDARSEGFVASPVIADGKLFVTDVRGTTYVIRAGPQFELLHTNRIDGRVRASAALADGRWYFRTDDHLLAIGQR